MRASAIRYGQAARHRLAAAARLAPLGSLIALLLSGCPNNKCKQGTVYLSLSFDSGTAAADQLDISLSVDGGGPVQRAVSRKPGKSSDQVDWFENCGYSAQSA